jgi:hypothetical protein
MRLTVRRGSERWLLTLGCCGSSSGGCGVDYLICMAPTTHDTPLVTVTNEPTKSLISRMEMEICLS